MEDITTIDLQQYIKKELFDETGRQEIWLHNLPNTSFLFDIINKLREKYKNETFVISQNINITNENIDKEVLFLDCFFENEISFENCIFFENAYFTDSIFNNSVYFANSTFKNDICFKKCFFINNPFFNYSFENVIFEGENIDFSNSEFYNVNFSKTIFGKSKKTHISFEGAKLSNTFFEKAKFKRKILFNKSKIKNGRITEIQNTKFNEAIFFDQANFQDVIFLGSISFEKTQFKGDTFFLKAKFYQINNNINNEYKNKLQENNDIKEKSEVNFKKCNFVGNIYFSEAFFETDVDFSGSLFNTISFGNAIFDRNVRFHKTTFNNNIDFFNTSFNKLVEFYRAHFYKPIQFHFTDFSDRAIFSSTEFDEEVQFLHCTVDSNSYIRFESATFKKSLDISRSNFNDKANFWNIELEEGNAFTSSKYQNDFDEKAKTESTKNTLSIYKKIRESYRIIKSNFYSQNNKIEGLKFYEKEMSVYLEENRNKKDNSENYFFNFCIKYIINFLANKKKEVNDSLLLKKCLTNKFINRLFTLLLILLYLPFCMLIILLSPIYITAILIHKITNIETKNTLHFIINFIFLGLYIFTKDLIWYIFFAPHFLYSILYSVPNLKRSISYSIKENNYISLIILFICLVSILVAVYGIPNQNNYILLWEGKVLSFNNDILTFISYISLIIIALLFVIIFKKNEKILLWFNKNSNNFGTNWFIGLNFTTLVALITYVVISLLSSNVILEFDAEGVGNFLKGLVKIINVTEWNDITFLGQELTNWQYIFLFIGRIFVAYGYYQTIQAFRKFGKS